MPKVIVECGYKYRIYPNQAQIEQIQKNFDCCRFAYNWCLRKWKDNWNKRRPTIKRAKRDDNGEVTCNEKGKAVLEEVENPDYDPEIKPISCFDMRKIFARLKYDEQYAWLADSDAKAIEYAVGHCDQAFKNFLTRWKKGKRGKEAGFPRFKKPSESKRAYSYTTSIGSTNLRKIDDGRIVLPKLGEIRIRYERPIDGTPNMATISRDAAGRYFVSIHFKDAVRDVKPAKRKPVAIMLNKSGTYPTSEGFELVQEKVASKYEKELAREQRILSRKKGNGKGQKKSAGWKKQKDRIAKIQTKIADVRRNIQHRLTDALTKTYSVIIVPELKLKEQMAVREGTRKRKHEKMPEGGYSRKAQRSINRHTTDLALFELVRQLKYKCQWRAGRCVVVPATTEFKEKCPVCGDTHTSKVSELGPAWTCHECGCKNERTNGGADILLALGKAQLKAEIAAEKAAA